MSTANQQPTPKSGGSTCRKRRRSSSLSSSSSSDVVIVLDDNATETEPPTSAPPQPMVICCSEGIGDKQNDESKMLEELRQARDALQRHRNGGTVDAASDGVVRTGDNEKEIEYIPGLVNRVLSESNRKGGHKRTVATTGLLVELVLGFVEPYVLQVSEERMDAGKTKTPGYNDDSFLSTSVAAEPNEYRDRAIHWATERIKDLLRPVDMESGADISELDALLSALGRYGGLKHEINVQERLREVLGRMNPMLLVAKVSDSTDILESKCAPGETAKNGDGEESTPSSTAVAERWSVSPEEWIERVARNIGAGDNNAEETDSMKDAMKSFPYLRQMKDFLERK